MDQARSLLANEGWELEFIPWSDHEVLLSGPDLDITPANDLASYEPDRAVAIVHSYGTTDKFPKLCVHRQKLMRAHHTWGMQAKGNILRYVMFMGIMPAFHMFSRSLSWSAPSNGLILAFYEHQAVPQPAEELSWLQAVSDTETTLAHGPPLLYEGLVRMPAPVHEPLHHVK